MSKNKMGDEEYKELYLQMRHIDEQIGAMHHQLERIDAQLAEISATKHSLDAARRLNNEEIYAPLAQGFFIKAKRIEEDGVLVHVGADTIVKKSFDEAKVLLDKQMSHITAFRAQMIERLELLYKQGEEVEARARSMTNV